MNPVRLASSRVLVPGLALAASLTAAAPASGADCIRQYAECLVLASDYDTWWQRSAAGIDCYLDAIDCLRAAYF
jgi:hypothetical protein